MHFDNLIVTGLKLIPRHYLDHESNPLIKKAQFVKPVRQDRSFRELLKYEAALPKFSLKVKVKYQRDLLANIWMAKLLLQ